MNIVIASGKGGTGKTLVATSLAFVASEQGACALLDVDVEAPNAALFLQPRFDKHLDVERLIPQVDEALCNHCGRCAEVCQYHAIASLPKKTIVFPEICHSCGSCARQCPQEAISEQPQPIGSLGVGWAGKRLGFAQGTLNIGEAMAPPVIRAVKRVAREAGWDKADLIIRDAPPGTACPVVEALKGADVAILVTEPTPFGLHDLQLAVDVARGMLSLPVGVVINKDRPGETAIDDYCRAERIPVLLRIPLDRSIAVAYSRGIPLVQAMPQYRPLFIALLQSAKSLVLGDER